MQANKERGVYAYSHCIHNKSTNPFHIKRFPKPIKPEEVKEVDANIYYFGHFQAPTSSVRKWSEDTSHPFVFEEWVVAHNGVLNNLDELHKKYCPSAKIQVDSSIIPLMLKFYSTDISDKAVAPEIAIKDALEKLQGTFALWIINRKHKRAFLARQGSTLYFNSKTGSFSSVECKSKYWISMPEGYVYEIDLKNKAIFPLNKFQTNSPFLFIPDEQK